MCIHSYSTVRVRYIALYIKAFLSKVTLLKITLLFPVFYTNLICFFTCVETFINIYYMRNTNAIYLLREYSKVYIATLVWDSMF